MCGIAGVLNIDLHTQVSETTLDRMGRVLVHRGPDEGGMFLRGPVGLSHRRLSIIDISSGRQPLLSDDGKLAIVFNGEIYNYKSLQKNLLKNGHRFRTQSDTEVILNAYMEYGERCVGYLRGMFAFAIWDGRRNQLFIARDRVGIKPLYYYWNGRRFIFASEIKAILEDLSVERDLDLQGLDDYLTYLYIQSPKTIFKAVRKLPAGHTLSISERGTKQEQYWDLSFDPKEGAKESDYAMGILEKLKESVSLHLMSEVPLGAFLSGGMDSSAVVGVMAGQLDCPVKTASIGFHEDGFDERPYARLVAKKFCTDAYEKIVRPDAVKVLDDLVWYFDEPFADSSMIPAYYVSQAARGKVTVCLSGDGGDENFAGYRRYRFDLLENRIRTVLPHGIRRHLFGLLGQIYPKADWLPQVLRAKTLFTNLSLSPEQAYFNTMSWFTPAMKRSLYQDYVKKALKDYEPFSVMKTYFDRTRDWDPLSRIQYVDIKTYLVDDILTKVDRASMAHSLEVRVPLLDHEFMEYAAGIPARYKLRNGEGKYIFKRAVGGLVPPEILNRPKMGFSVPLAQWFRTDLKGMFEGWVFSKDAFIGSLFNLDSVQQWWNQHQRRTRDYSYHLWALLVLERWGRRFVNR
jgi:asparagine synthase (glutamine-hydrolysing)